MKDARAAVSLRIHLLGGFHLEAEGETPPAIVQPRLQFLLAYLLLHRDKPIPRQQIAFAFWPDTSERQAHANLRNLLHRLRASLGGRFIEFDRHCVWWRGEDRVGLDVADFEQRLAVAERASGDPVPALTAALACYPGDLLPECYDDWIAPARERLRQAAQGAFTRLSALLEARGDYPAAIGATQRLLQQDPLNEATYRDLMRLHALAGDRAGVVRVFNACTATLQRELSAPPDRETDAAYHAAGELAVRVAGQRGAAPTPEQRPPRRAQAPPEFTGLIGRQQETAHVCDLLEDRRMVTLTGAGGIGKSRLAQRVATVLAERYGDGIGWADLRAVADEALIGSVVAAALGAREEPTRSTIEALTSWLHGRHLLLVMDNCEHLAGPVGRLAQELLEATPRLHILATSQRPLGIPGELTWRVPSLATPGDSALSPHEALVTAGQNASVQLFVERAQAALPAFSLTASNAVEVARLCRRLGGIPLAIELAAAHISTLTVQQIVERLDDALTLLGSAGSHQKQTLAAALAWSHDLLTRPEQILFRRLAAFPGSFSLDAAEAVCAGHGLAQGQIVSLLAGLVDKSLVEPEPLRGQRRFRMHEVVRQFAQARLAEAGETDRLRARHFDACVRLVGEGESHLSGAQQAAWFERLEAEHDNLRAALACGRTNIGCVEIALALVGGLGHFWATRGHFKEGRHWARTLLAAASTAASSGRLAALRVAANLAYYQADFADARALYEQALDVARSVDDRVATAMILRGLGSVAHSQGDHGRAFSAYRESLALCREIGDRAGEATALANLGLASWQHGDSAAGREQLEACLALRRQLGDEVGIAYVLHLLADLAWSEGRAVEARALNDESLVMRRRLGDKWGIAYSLDSLAVMARDQGDRPRARALFAESLALFHELDSQLGLSETMDHAAGLLADQGDRDSAGRLMAAADAMRRAIAAALPPNAQAGHDRQLAGIRERLGDERFCAAWTLGGALLTEQAVALALQLLAG